MLYHVLPLSASIAHQNLPQIPDVNVRVHDDNG
jgi:hypothetical protein